MSELQKPINYTNRELGLMLGQINDALASFITLNSQEHKEVMKRQDHTNGDVKSLKLWKARISGAIAVIAVITSFLAFQTELVSGIVKIAFKN